MVRIYLIRYNSSCISDIFRDVGKWHGACPKEGTGHKACVIPTKVILGWGMPFSTDIRSFYVYQYIFLIEVEFVKIINRAILFISRQQPHTFIQQNNISSYLGKMSEHNEIEYQFEEDAQDVEWVDHDTATHPIWKYYWRSMEKLKKTNRYASKCKLISIHLYVYLQTMCLN